MLTTSPEKQNIGKMLFVFKITGIKNAYEYCCLEIFMSSAIEDIIEIVTSLNIGNLK